MVVVAIVLLAILTSQDGWRFFVPSEVAHFGMVIANHTIRAAGHHSRGVYRRLSLGHVDGVQIASRIPKRMKIRRTSIRIKEEGRDRHRKNQTKVLYAIWKMVVCRERFFFFFFYLRHVPIKVSLCSRSD